jgi:hypothetical protein
MAGVDDIRAAAGLFRVSPGACPRGCTSYLTLLLVKEAHMKVTRGFLKAQAYNMIAIMSEGGCFRSLQNIREQVRTGWCLADSQIEFLSTNCGTLTYVRRCW